MSNAVELLTANKEDQAMSTRNSNYEATGDQAMMTRIATEQKAQKMTRNWIGTSILAAFVIGMFCTSAVHAATLFSDDFDGYAAGNELEDTASWTRSTSFSSNKETLFIRDDSTATPFGSSNKYIEITDDSTTLGLEVKTTTEGRLVPRQLMSGSRHLVRRRYMLVRLRPRTPG